MASLDPRWRLKLQALAASVLALWLGWGIAAEQSFAVGTGGALLGLFLLSRAQPVPLPALFLGLCCAGMMIGNRGFAQLSPTERLPLFPAELTLALGAGLLLPATLLGKNRPWRADPLNLVIIVWILLCSARLPHDLREYGVLALRDYATVYYAGFYFLARAACTPGVALDFLKGVLLWAPLLMLPSYAAFSLFPDFFLGPAAIHGIPLVYFKGDLAGTFMAAGAIQWFMRYEERRQLRALLPGLLLTAVMLSTLNRASLLGLALALLLPALRGRWRTGAWLGFSASCSLLLLLTVLQFQNRPLQDSPLHTAGEQLSSLVDPAGQGTYNSELVGNKGDNNRFRLVWWEVCIRETLAWNPLYGLGWGHDLATPFLRVYFPDSVSDFGARSPHSVLVSLFARSGVLGLGSFLLILSLIVRYTWQSLKSAPSAVTGCWLACLVLLTSACFGVVLEGPMGAMVFWTCLGCAAQMRASLDTGLGTR